MIRDSDITLKKQNKKKQRELEDDLNIIVSEKWDHISAKEQKLIIEKVIKIFDDHSTVVSEAKFKATHRKGHKVLN